MGNYDFAERLGGVGFSGLECQGMWVLQGEGIRPTDPKMDGNPRLLEFF